VGTFVKAVVVQLDEASHIKDYPLWDLKSGLQLIHDLFTERLSLVQSCADSSLLVSGLYFLAFLEESEIVKELACHLWSRFRVAQMIDLKIIKHTLRDWIYNPGSPIRYSLHN
jgi:hypothetical protein